jgi:DNA-directed RNA polymerase subunit RPC12/RpoP
MDSLPNMPPRGFIPAKSAVPGITVFAPAPEKEKLDEVVDFSCPQCGGETAYSVEDGGLTCTYCGYHEAPKNEVVGRDAESFEFTVETIKRAVQGWGEERKELLCRSCGGQISLPDGALTAACPFCSSNKVIHHAAAQDALRPRFLIPFQIDEARCQQIGREWLGDSWLVPKELRRLASVSTFTPLYLPFWTFGSTSDATWRAQVGRTETYRSGGKTKRKTVWRWENGHVRHSYSDLLARGTNHVSLHLLEQINNYDLDGLTPYDAQYLAGMQAQAYEVQLEDAWAMARQTMREDTKKKCRDQASTNKIRNFSMHLDFQDESWRYILLPIYINTYYFENKPYQLLMNGQTGKIAGQRPADWRKIALLSVGLILPGLLLFFFFLLFMPDVYGSGGGFGSFFFFIAGLLIAIAIALRAQKLDKI